ncbi:hypothetical protein NIES2135_08940 [Leptolyngbya boryana NIES-2135]|jgi:hypothetical protein|uniref:Uncharacterized protein n=1 Tax=Leptolyngbya boryana NIES-2135 TaxID=1973484 RepID=A0A1Z4JBK5_LEPBY|nr:MULTISPECIES: hypothetical protein [Leptolyngbya]BAY54080.1 hypothetical protein NIES2135_08940 [Leptolyngbya boryana NIES-2135]MBD2369737.1 hypothetical protein [Leptolyngbya sp. FACHB-161]MBD2376062.1 hypothetical protein [Leptolyngbya sp. FACHB-238]MBD2400338.1 hypothetical protein [Leptolyngbya sp. FACHB-239]MBD2406879.1 hypothetical protein [Leptolyngbya sp. FACHB-402]
MLRRRLEQFSKSTLLICGSLKNWAKDQPDSRAKLGFENLIELQVTYRTAPIQIESELYSEFTALSVNRNVISGT